MPTSAFNRVSWGPWCHSSLTGPHWAPQPARLQSPALGSPWQAGAHRHRSVCGGVRELMGVCLGRVVSMRVFSFFIFTRNSERRSAAGFGKVLQELGPLDSGPAHPGNCRGTGWPQSLACGAHTSPSSPTRAPPTSLRFTDVRPALASLAVWQAGCPTASLGPSPLRPGASWLQPSCSGNPCSSAEWSMDNRQR